MKKLLVIMVLGLLFSGCSKKDRMDVYSCANSNIDPELYAIGADFVVTQYKTSDANKISIDDETKDNIVAIDKFGLIFNFYKRTNAAIIQFPKPISQTFTLKCEKIN
jgi:hypothetical protein